jgi:hypothetical protein
MKKFLLSLTLLAVVVALPAFAENNSVMNVHVNKAVAIPGKVLAPGDYVFRLLNVGGGGSPVVAISSADYSAVYGFVQVYASYRNEPSATEIQSVASEGSDVKRIDSWFFPGQKDGYRFIYSKSDLEKLAVLGGKKTMGDVAGQ